MKDRWREVLIAIAGIIVLFTLVILMSGCAVHRSPDGKAFERSLPHITLLVCIFASCELDPKTPTPPPSQLETAPAPQASQLYPTRGRRGAALTGDDDAKQENGHSK